VSDTILKKKEDMVKARTRREIYILLPFQKSSNHFFFLTTNKSIIRNNIASTVQIILTTTKDLYPLGLICKYIKNKITDIILCATPDFIPYPA
jgi:hypothetical protein